VLWLLLLLELQVLWLLLLLELQVLWLLLLLFLLLEVLLFAVGPGVEVFAVAPCFLVTDAAVVVAVTAVAFAPGAAFGNVYFAASSVVLMMLLLLVVMLLFLLLSWCRCWYC